FLKEVNGFNFGYHSIVINKRKLTSERFCKKEEFYIFACKIVLDNAAKELTDATVILDKCGSWEFQRKLCGHLRREVNIPDAPTVVIKKLKTQDSKTNNLLQLADMICGAVARSYSDKKDPHMYRKWIRPREKRVQFWPKE